MNQKFGNDTVTFVVITDGALDRNNIAAEVKTRVVVHNCRMRPFNAEEAVGLTDLATELWKCTAPPHPAVLAAKAIDRMEHKGITYQIVGGVKPYPMSTGAVRKVTVMGQKQTG